ncbi:MAG: hypothetical protein ABSG49_12110 [Methanoregula sp.]|jgi:transposase|uniref:hypothetical protein n=1 Tax=Methanoregula sp. TaxID=2052170 RepID=UPI003C1FB36B
MGEQVHKRVTDEQMRMIMERYLAGELSASHAMELLGLKRSQFFEWVQKYKNHPESFSIEYRRKGTNRQLDERLHAHILQELEKEKALIDDPSIPIRFYNYSYIQDRLREHYRAKVSLPAIIDRAKKTAITSRNRTRPPMTGK